MIWRASSHTRLVQGANCSLKRGHGSCSSLRGAATPKHRLQALMLDAPPAPPPTVNTPDIIHEALEQADELIEEFVWSRGLIPAAECFEQFGWTEAAPSLRDGGQPVTEEQRKALATCLATPFMYDNEHLSRQAQEKINDRSEENSRRLTTRFAEEVSRPELEQTEREASSYAGEQALARSRRRRRQEESSWTQQTLSSAPPLAGRTPSPHTQRVLSRTVSSLEDHSNKLHMDESELAEKKAAAIVNSSLNLATLSMDAPDQALFSMDDPVVKSHANLAPGGVMVVSLDNNMMTAQQQTAEVTDDSSASSDAVNASDGNSSSGSVSNDKNAVHGKPENGVQGTVKGNVVPFARSKVPHSQA